jgi:hypothetical protein
LYTWYTAPLPGGGGTGVGAGSGGGGVAATTSTETDFEIEPPIPLHVRPNVEFAVMGGVRNVSLTDLFPLHAPLAVQFVASVPFHVRVTVCPFVTLVADDVRVSVGAGITSAVTDCVADPPIPVQVSVKTEEALTAVVCEPEIGFAPDHASPAVHEVVSVELQVSVTDSPLAISFLFIANESVG